MSIFCGVNLCKEMDDQIESELEEKQIRKLNHQFASLASDAMNMRRNVSFNNVSAFPAIPRGEIKTSSSNLSLFTKTPQHMGEPDHGTGPEAIFSTKRLVVVMVGLPARGKVNEERLHTVAV